MTDETNGAVADVCLLLEGCYPYVSGGVSSWVQDLITTQGDLSFHVLALLPTRAEYALKFELPKNVTGVSHIYLQDLEHGVRPKGRHTEVLEQLEGPLTHLQKPQGGYDDVAAIIQILGELNETLGQRLLLNSEATWRLLLRMYQATMPQSSFLNYFWTWRSIMSGLFTSLTSPLPRARVYHTISTGYAGLVATRAKIETGRPMILTEHGIYTNERRIEITLAEWIEEAVDEGLTVDRQFRDLRDVWIDAFESYAKACYDACDSIITLYTGNQEFQLRLGADAGKLRIIPNGVDYEKLAGDAARLAAPKAARPPTVALIGRVVSIKDIKTFIQACAGVYADVPDLDALILGPMDEEPEYYAECVALTEHLGLTETVKFMGRVQLGEYLGRIDVMVLTSISEAQPLVILEAAAAGVPTVATDVGSCRELLFGQPNEEPKLGPGGAVTPVGAPIATATEIKKLLQDRAWWQQCSDAIRERVRLHYDKADIFGQYRTLYGDLAARDDAPSHSIGQA